MLRARSEFGVRSWEIENDGCGSIRLQNRSRRKKRNRWAVDVRVIVVGRLRFDHEDLVFRGKAECPVQFEGADIAAIAVGRVGDKVIIERPADTAFVLRNSKRIAMIDGKAAGQQFVGWKRAAKVSQGRDDWIDGKGRGTDEIVHSVGESAAVIGISQQVKTF